MANSKNEVIELYDTITINKELVPYSFDILLGGETFEITVNYNETYDFFTFGLSKDGEIICDGEKIIYGNPLFEEIFENGKFPSIEIIPYDISGESDAVTFDNLSSTVQLIINDQETSVI